MFVADTNVISASDPTKSRKSEKNADLEGPTIYLTAMTVSEVRSGILRLYRIGSIRKAAELDAWWGRIELIHGDRILPFDLTAANVAAELADRAAAAGHDPGWIDIQIAAIAASRGYTVLTRNVRHFVPLGVPYLDPFAEDAIS